MEPILFILICAAIFLALEGVYELVHAQRRTGPARVRERLRTLGSKVSADAKNRETLLRRSRESGASLFARRLELVPSVERLIYQAGMVISPTRLAAISLALAAGGWLLGARLLEHPLLGAVGVVAGAVPLLIVRQAASKRMAKFSEALPEALELITRALRAGHALVTGFQIVGEELHDPVSTEFALVAEEMRLGVELRDALRGMVRRVDNPDLPYFVTAVLIQQQTGGNLAEVLGNLGGLLRERSQFFGKVRAMTAQGRAAALVLALWLPFITVVIGILAPTYMEPLLTTTWGNLLLVSVGILDVASYVMARRIATVEP